MAIALGLLVVISCLSGYDLSSAHIYDFDIAVILTPYGILKNLVFLHTYLSPFYWEISQREGVLQNVPLLFVIIDLVACALVLLFNFKERYKE